MVKHEIPFSPETAFLSALYTARHITTAGNREGIMISQSRGQAHADAVNALKTLGFQIRETKGKRTRIYSKDLVKALDEYTVGRTRVPLQRLDNETKIRSYLKGLVLAHGEFRAITTPRKGKSFNFKLRVRPALKNAALLFSQLDVFPSINNTGNLVTLTFAGHEMKKLLQLGLLSEEQKKQVQEALGKRQVLAEHHGLDAIERALRGGGGVNRATLLAWMNGKNVPRAARRLYQHYELAVGTMGYSRAHFEKWKETLGLIINKRRAAKSSKSI